MCWLKVVAFCAGSYGAVRMAGWSMSISSQAYAWSSLGWSVVVCFIVMEASRFLFPFYTLSDPLVLRFSATPLTCSIFRCLFYVIVALLTALRFFSEVAKGIERV